MGFSGELKRVPARRLQELLVDPGGIFEELYPADPGDSGAWLSIEKSFDGLHFLFGRLATGGKIPFASPLPWFAPTMDGTETGAVLDYGPVCFRTPDQVAELAAVLASISRELLRSVFDPAGISEKKIYPETWERGEDEFEYLWVYFQDLRDFYQQAAREGQGVLLWLA